jgi:archaemetzincin
MTSKKLSFNLLLICILSILLACNSNNETKHNIETTSIENKKEEKLTIIIQPFSDLPAGTAEKVATELKAMYAGHVVVKSAIPLPQRALNYNRTRYRADSLIEYLGTLVEEDQLIIGLTARDISTTKGDKPDWGVMGLGFCPGKSCIASSFRLKGNNKQEKLFKVAIHELGHTQGIAQTNTKHCPNKTCFMRDAEGKDHLNELTHFCSACKPILVKAGWALK